MFRLRSGSLAHPARLGNEELTYVASGGRANTLGTSGVSHLGHRSTVRAASVRFPRRSTAKRPWSRSRSATTASSSSTRTLFT
jgi:hypothetical protein